MPAVGRKLIRCMNVKFSPNLGDGLLSECLEAALVEHGADPATSSVDLAARTAYGQGLAGRGLVMAVLEAMPGPLRQRVVRLPLAIQARRRWRPYYARGLAGAEAVAIGGGNLFSDHDLNFPTKLSLAFAEAARLGLPTAIFACGMASDWSAEGLRRVRQALAAWPPCAVFLRDDASKARWDALLAPTAGREAVVVRDPGLLASSVYPQPARSRGGRPRIGIGLMSHVAIRYHAEARLSAAALGRWYVDLARALVAGGAKVTAFTNGAPEDVAAAEALRGELLALPGAIRLVTPRTPAELAGTIAACDALAAYRMHAVIAAYSYGLPALALAWDQKLAAFMRSVGQADLHRDPAELPASEAAKILLAAAERATDAAGHDAVIAEARRDVGLLYAALTGARDSARS